MTIDLVFPVRGEPVPVDHAYPLYAALSAAVPAFHEPDSLFRFAPLTGHAVGDGVLAITDRSMLRVRLPDDQVRAVLPLAGKRLAIGDAAVRLGVPSIRTLEPAVNLFARVVTFKNAVTAEHLLATARTKLTELGITGEPQLPIHLAGDQAGEPRRKVVRVKGAAIVGYSLLVTELTAAHSLALQERGLGGRTQIGCGFFLPAKEDER